MQPRAPRGQDALRRDRPRDRPRRDRALPLRRRGPQPARLPHLRRPRGGAAGAAARARRCAREQPARRKEALESLESLAAVCTPPQAPAAGPRPAPADRRGVSGPLRAARCPPARAIAGHRAARSGRWSPIRTTCRAGGPDHAGRERRAAARASAASGPRCSRPREGAACAPTTAASAPPRASATSGSRSSRTRRSSASCGAPITEIRLEPSGGRHRGDDRACEQTLRGLSRLGSPMMRRATGRILDEALDGLERAVGGRAAEARE